MAVAVAARPLRRRTLEREGMTPEQELELLIAEQKADDTYFVDRPSFVLSLDAPSPSGDGAIGDLIGRDEEGDLISFVGSAPAFAPDTTIPHGNRGRYTKYGCRCRPCKAANSAFIREYRKGRRAES